VRALSLTGAAALESAVLPVALLIDMDLTSPLRLCTGGWQLEWDGNTYTPTNGIGNVEPVRETASGHPQALRFSVSGVPSSMVALALAEPVQGRAVTVYVAIFDPAAYTILDAVAEWVGTLDTMSITEGGGTATITVTAEHAGIDLLRAVPVRYTDSDQQRLFPGDLGFQYITDQSDRTIVWPAASFFRQ